MAVVFPDTEQYAVALEQAAKRLRQTDEIGGQALSRVEQFRAEVQRLTELNTTVVADLASLREESASLREQLAASQLWWFAPLREQLSHEEYKTAVEAKDPAECLRLLRVPLLEPANEIPAARVRLYLIPMRSRLKGLPVEGEYGQDFWNETLNEIMNFVTISMDDPLTKSLLDGAQKLGLLTEEEVAEMATLPQSAIDRLFGIAVVVSSPRTSHKRWGGDMPEEIGSAVDYASGASGSGGSGSRRFVKRIRLITRLITLPPGATIGPEFCDDADDCAPCGSTGSSGGSSGGVSGGSGVGPWSGPEIYPVVTVCGTIPSVLLVEVSTGEEFYIVYDSGTDWWYGLTGDDLVCPPELAFGLTMQCVDDAIVLGVIASWRGPALPGNPTSVSYSPFMLTYSGLDDGGGACSPTLISLTVSELP